MGRQHVGKYVQMTFLLVMLIALHQSDCLDVDE